MTAKKSNGINSLSWRSRYQLAHQHWFAKQYPVVYNDNHYSPPLYPNVRKSNGLTLAIVNYINWMGFRAKRINNQGRLMAGTVTEASGNKFTVKKWIPSMAGRGQADISATINGKSVQLEIKAGRDKPSEYQLLEQQKERNAGGIYEFIYNMDEFYELFDKIGKPIPPPDREAAGLWNV